MFSKLCVSILVVAVLFRVTKQAAINSNIFVDKSTVKCVDTAFHGEPGDFVWQPKSLLPHEPSIPVKIQKKCINKKLIVRLQVVDDPSASPPKEDALLVIDEIENELVGGKLRSRLSYPVILKVSQLTPSILTYPLKLLYRVNAQPYEEVLSLQTSTNYVGCYFGPEATKPTCGSANGGFCCSCGSVRGNKCSKPFSEVSEVLQSSAHCIRFSPFLYGVYLLGEPQIYHQVSIQVFKSEELENSTIQWEGLLPGKGVTLTTQKSRLSLNSVDLTFRDAKENVSSLGTVNSYLDVTNSRLLIPMPNPVSVTEGDTLPVDDLSALNHPSFEKGSKVEDALLVLSKSLLGPEGLECNRVGTSNSAFMQQNDSCGLPRNSCLQNQPLDLWKSGEYSLSAYGPVVKMTSPVKFVAGGRDGALLMENRNNGVKKYFLDLEIAEWKEMHLLSGGYNPILEFVMTDTSWRSGAKVTARVINSERVASKFKVELKNCPGGIDEQSEMKWIRPLGSETFIIDLERVRGVNETEGCAFVVVNEMEETVGGRDIKFMDGDTCICAGRCKCVCTKTGVGCERLENEALVAAGMELWDEEVMGTANSTSGGETVEAFEEIVSLDEAVTRWWYWLGALLGLPIVVLLLIGVIFWNFCKCKKKSDLNYVEGSFPEGDKRHFSIGEVDDVDGKLSERLPKTASTTTLWSKRSDNRKENDEAKSNQGMLPRESKKDSPEVFSLVPKSSSSRGGGDALLSLKSTKNLQAASLTQAPSSGNRSRNQMSGMLETQASGTKTLSPKDSKIERVDSTTIETVSASKQNAASSSSDENSTGRGLGGDSFSTGFFEGTMERKNDGPARYGSWHRRAVASSKSILELCELVSTSDEKFTIYDRPDPHFNDD